MDITNYVIKIRKPIIFTSGLLFTVFIGWLDYITGPYLVLSLFYLFPISAISWFCGRNYGLLSAVLTTIILLTADLMVFVPITPHFIIYWNTLIRSMIFIIVVLGLSQIQKDREYIKKDAAREKLSARTDSLTGLANALSFYEILNQEMERARRYNNHFSIAYIDLDNFKDVNDKYGHLIGDELLQKIAVLIKQNIRNIDTAARLGGDEYVVLMPETPTIKGRAVIERLNKIFLGEMAKNEWPVTMSAGIASFSQIPSTADIIISKADELMYIAKNNGKNRIEERVF
jgi:diguanylate cyclase (GGDEF)-like protein